jgi:hypothetical protein
MVLLGRTITEGIEKAGIARTTFYEWLKEATFREEFERQRKDIIEQGLHELKMSVSEAAMVLRELLKSESEGVRLKSAVEILNHAGRFMEIEDVQRRLTALEQKRGKRK